MLNLVETRNRHFLQAARRVIASVPKGGRLSMIEVARRAAMSRAPHYYCTYDYALRVLRVLEHDRMPMRRDRRLEMFAEIRAKCHRYMSSLPGMKLGDALAIVLASEGASQFFISPSTALRLVQSLGREAVAAERRAG